MAITFTPRQQSVLDARSHNIIVSAAAGSGKTAVLVERIIRMITEPNPVTGAAPLDIDRLLVVTFTRAAAAQMRERIAQAIARRLVEHPDDRHLQRQETLLHHAQITTIDSFCTFLLRNNYSDIDLDPGFRQMDETEAILLRGDVMESFLADQFEQGDPAFRALVDTWCKDSDDSGIADLIAKLYAASNSHPDPIRWLRERRSDYDLESLDDVLMAPWMADMYLQVLLQLQGLAQMLQAGDALALRPGGPAAYSATFEQELQEMFAPFSVVDPMAGLEKDIETLQRTMRELSSVDAGAAAVDHASATDTADTADTPTDNASTDKASADHTAAYQATRERILEQRREIQRHILQALEYPLPKLKAVSTKKGGVDPQLKDRAKAIHDAFKKQKDRLRANLTDVAPELQLYLMQRAAASLHTLIDLTIDFTIAFREAKEKRDVIDFADLERLALNILLKEQEDPAVPGGVRYVARPTALAYRAYYDEVLIDEYQDSNEVQELLLRTIAGEEDGRYARFMVGDVKQSIYRFRNARPEIFVDKLDHYMTGDPQTERIDLDQNFRSRREVLDATNDVFLRVMRREVGGVTYDDLVSLKPGATYEDPDDRWAAAKGIFGDDLYRAQLLLVGNDAADAADGAADIDGQGTDASGDSAAANPDADEIRAMTRYKKEALAVAQEIRALVGVYPVTDHDTHELRPARYGDIVILLRSGTAWNDALREILTREGIPMYVDYKAGYFAAEEIREVLQALTVIDNPMQDIPLYGMMHGYFGQFSDDDLGKIRAAANARHKAAQEAAARGAQAPAAAGVSARADGSTTEGSADGQGVQPDPRQADDARLEEPDLLMAVRTYVEEPALAARCKEFLERLDALREESRVTPIHQFIGRLITQTGYENYVAALPAGAQRRANLQSLLVKAAAFEQTQYAGLFEFLRYLKSMRQYEVDYGEANVLDEKADVVRLMTIHKSKGLEFPIVFVMGLSGRFAFKGKDTSGPLIIDPDLGLGIDYIDPDLRARVSTLRKSAVASRISNSSLGEELRILYVAMTRAEERLYLTGFVGDIDKYYARIDASRAAILDPDEQLPVQVITSASSYLDLVMLARDDNTRIDLREIRVKDLTVSAEEEQLTLGMRRKALEALQHTPIQSLPQPALAMQMEERFAFRYPHADLEGLYTKCSVSDVKHTVYETLAKGAAGISDETEEAITDAAVEMYEIPPEEDADIPRFIREAEEASGEVNTNDATNAAGASDAAGAAGVAADAQAPIVDAQASARHPQATMAPLRGAARGTAIHRALQLVDYRAWQNPVTVSAAQFDAWVTGIVAAGLVPRSYESTLTARTFLPFLQSGIAARMAAAAERGELRREQPFVLGVPADTVNPVFPHKETMLVQGIIDAFWIEENESGRGIVIVDYKTDYVQDPQELIDRYDVQLRYYAQALSRILHLPVHQRILYSFRLQREIVLPE